MYGIARRELELVIVYGDVTEPAAPAAGIYTIQLLGYPEL
jgi:hypothetical protein